MAIVIRDRICHILPPCKEFISSQVNLGQLHNIRGVATQGRHDANQWVTSFSLAYTADDFNWVYIRENSQVKVFIEKNKSTEDDISVVVSILR